MEVLNTFVDFQESAPLRKQFLWQTDVVKYETGKEQRNQVWSEPIRMWFINFAILPVANRNELIELFQRMYGRFGEFLYEDADDNTYALSAFTGAAYAITAIDQAADTFTIAGNHTDYFIEDATFDVQGSTNNNGKWTVESSTFTGGNTVISVTGAVGAVADGNIHEADFQLYKTY